LDHRFSSLRLALGALVLLAHASSGAGVTSAPQDGARVPPNCESGEMLLRVSDRRHTPKGTLLTLAEPHGRAVVAELLIPKRELASYSSYQRGAYVCFPG